MILETLGIVFLVFAGAAAIAWCKDWVVAVTRKYWGNNTSKMVDWALRIVMMIGFGQVWIDFLSQWREHLVDLRVMFQKGASAVANT